MVSVAQHYRRVVKQWAVSSSSPHSCDESSFFGPIYVSTTIWGLFSSSAVDFKLSLWIEFALNWADLKYGTFTCDGPPRN